MQIQKTSYNTPFKARLAGIKDPDYLLDLTQRTVLESIIKGKGKPTDWVHINISPIKKGEPESYMVNVISWVDKELRCYSMTQTNSRTIYGSIKEIPAKLPFKPLLNIIDKTFTEIPKRFKKYISAN